MSVAVILIIVKPEEPPSISHNVQSKKTAMNKRSITCTALSMIALNTIVAPANSQVQVPLQTAHCLEMPGQNFSRSSEFSPRGSQEITIGRQILNTVFSLAPQIANETKVVVCKIQSKDLPKFKGFKTLFGVEDNAYNYLERQPTKVSFFSDGRLANSQVVKPGEMFKFTIDLYNTKNLAIELTCENKSQGQCPPIHFIEAFLF